MSARQEPSLRVSVTLGLSFVILCFSMTLVIVLLGPWLGVPIAIVQFLAYMALLGGLLDPKNKRQ